MRISTLIGCLLLLACLASELPARPVQRISRTDLAAGLRDVERLIEAGRLVQAREALDRLERAGADPTPLLARRILLHAAAGEDDIVVRLAREGLDALGDVKRLRHALIGALARLDSLDAARSEVRIYLGEQYLNLSDAAEMVSVWRESGHPEEGVALCDSLRMTRADPRLLSRQRLHCQAVLDDADEVAAECLRLLSINPLDLDTVRRDLRDHLSGSKVAHDVRTALAESRDETNGAAVALLTVDISLWLGDREAALTAVEGHDWRERESMRLARLATLLATELPTYEERSRTEATGAWLFEVLGDLIESSPVPPAKRAPLKTALAGVCADLLETGPSGELVGSVPPEDIRQALTGLRDRGHFSDVLLTAQVRLADHQREVQGRPGAAIEDLDDLLEYALPTAGAAEARLSLGRCRLAVGDTSAARGIFVVQAADTLHVTQALDAALMLARMDIAQGHWDAGREGLAGLAERDPGADAANDALDLGLLAAELLEAGPETESARALYARSLHWRLAGEDARRRSVLDSLAAIPASSADWARLTLIEQARLELAELHVARGDVPAAIAQCDSLIRRFPDGRYPARAMLLKADLLHAAGDRTAATRVLEILLVQYPDTPQAELARLRLEKGALQP